MSLQALPAELYFEIIKYLGTGDISRLTRVSKGYRTIGEPILYEYVCFYNDETDNVKLLLMTLLQRKDLHKHIRILKVFHDNDAQTVLPPLEDGLTGLPCDWRGDDFYDRFAAHTTAIKEAIDKVASSYFSSQTRMTWLSRVLEPYPRFDGALALVIGMATNIFAITLELSPSHPLTATLDYIAYMNLTGPQNDSSDHPLQELESVRIHGDTQSSWAFPVAIPAGLKTLDIVRNKHLELLVRPTQPFGGTNALTNLYLQEVNFDPAILENAIGNDWLHNLEELVATEMCAYRPPGFPSPQPLDTYDYGELKKTMQEHLPQLKKFVWSRTDQQRSRTLWKPFGTFSEFGALDILRINYDLFVIPKQFHEYQFPGFAFFKDSLPSNLKELEFLDISWAQVFQLYEMHLNTEDKKLAALHTLRQLAQSLPMKHLGMTIDMTAWFLALHNAIGLPGALSVQLAEAAVDFLRLVADDLDEIGVFLEIRYYVVMGGKRMGTLVEPGFTADHIHV